MNNRNGLIGRGSQAGLVLPVALLLLVVLTITAVASMRGTTMQERMAVGQIQMHSSFLLSEQIAWDAAACIRSKYMDEDDEFISPPDQPEVVINECEKLVEGAVIRHTEDPWRYTVIAARAFRDTGAVSPVVLEVITPGGGLPSLPNLAPYACFGSNCELTRAPSAASPTADGTNRLAPDIGERCRIQGRHRPDVNEDGIDAPGVIIPDGELLGDWGKKGAAEGEPPYINDPGDWAIHPSNTIEGSPEQYIDDIADAYWLRAVTPDGPLKNFEPGDKPKIWKAGPNETITIDGGNSTVFGVLIIDGGRLEMRGNQCFVGSIIFRNGGEMVALSGTPATVGSVIGYADDEGDVINPSMGGNPSFYYSDIGKEIAEFWTGADFFGITRWRAPIDLSAFNL